MGHSGTITFVALLALAACEKGPPPPEIAVSGATVQLPAAPGRPGSAYFTATANIEPETLVGVSSPGLGRVELHGTMDMATSGDMAMPGKAGMGSMSAMRPLTGKQLGFAPDAPLTFAPGDKHAMIYDMPRTLKAGVRIPLTFAFQGETPITVWADVREAGDPR